MADTLPMDERGVALENDQDNVHETGEEECDREDDAEVELVEDHEQQDRVSRDDMDDSPPAAANKTPSAKDKTQAPESETQAQPDETPPVVSEEEGPEACKGTHKDCTPGNMGISQNGGGPKPIFLVKQMKFWGAPSLRHSHV